MAVGALTVTAAVACEVVPTLLFAVEVTVKLPACEYACAAVGPEELVPSPQLFWELVIVPEVAVTVAVTVPPVVMVAGVTESEVARD